MKKSLFVLCCLLCVFTLSQSQSLILKGGGSLANVGSTVETKNKPGIVAGVAFEIPLGAHFSIQPELLFNQKGFKGEGSFVDGIEFPYNVDYKSKYTLNYLELPVLIKYKFGIFYVNAGPSVSYGVGGHYSATFSGDNFKNSTTSKGKVKFGSSSLSYVGDDYNVENAFDVGIQIGGGIKVYKHIIIDVRYGFGLSGLFDKSDVVSLKKISHITDLFSLH